MMPSGTWSWISAVVLVTIGWTSIAAAAPAAAIFPFEIYDTSGEAPQPDLTERLAMATRVLSEALEKTGAIRRLISDRSARRLRRPRRVTDVETVSCLSHVEPALPSPWCPWCTRCRR